MSAAVGGALSAHANPVQKEVPHLAKHGRFRLIGKIALATLATLAIAVGSAAAIAGAVVGVKVIIVTGFLMPLFIPCVKAAGHLFAISMKLMKHDSTALGAMFTLPLAVLCLSPFVVPIAVGAAPGGALIGLGAWGWSQL